MKRIAATLFAFFLASTASAQQSLVNTPAEEIQDHLAELFVVAFHCRDHNLRHNSIDLVWDIVELKTGEDPNSETQSEIVAAMVERWDQQFRSTGAASCQEAYSRFGPSGTAISDVMYER